MAALVATGALAPPPSWLDGPIRPWSDARPGVPPAEAGAWAGRDDCLGPRPDGPEAAQLRASGWRPFQLFDRPIGRGAVVVLGGLRDVTADCAPAAFQVFVFVDGAFAGTLSPVEMTTGRDGVVGAIRVLPDDRITAEFARYKVGDGECCPSGRVRVSYRIDRTGGPARVLAVDRASLRE
ncbi:MAG: LppP/LprE family lipoprotein [Vicinamibacterales bacterium]